MVEYLYLLLDVMGQATITPKAEFMLQQLERLQSAGTPGTAHPPADIDGVVQPV